MTKPRVNDSDIVSVKSKFEADIIRFSISMGADASPISFEEFRKSLAEKHGIGEHTKFIICYSDPIDNDLLPITNDNNLARAIATTRPLLKVYIQRQDDASQAGGASKPRTLMSSIWTNAAAKAKPLVISEPRNFRQVSAIIDVDILPATSRRVRILKHSMDKPLGFYVKNGDSYRLHANRGIEKVQGVFISRVVPGGLAEATGLLAVDDEVLEVNGIDVVDRTLDQVTDMMVANSSNLVITVKPAISDRQSQWRSSRVSSGSQKSAATRSSEEDTDEIVDLTVIHQCDHVATHYNEFEEVTHL
ncbi:partitioning defective 6 homolog gamma-like [Phymastichus coffea]|uniref:partitioning defective 6 homolog gamma-like n=1 Tax=Phymastichus coffea TaxID=108790 RepID=UPI00273B4556|nr:partitioning defective 6 homolog gamma-like [Phymastichus coffea]